jgi:hypothetical protein
MKLLDDPKIPTDACKLYIIGGGENHPEFAYTTNISNQQLHISREGVMHHTMTSWMPAICFLVILLLFLFIDIAYNVGTFTTTPAH